jgi:hypothetical protein
MCVELRQRPQPNASVPKLALRFGLQPKLPPLSCRVTAGLMRCIARTQSVGVFPRLLQVISEYSDQPA